MNRVRRRMAEDIGHGVRTLGRVARAVLALAHRCRRRSGARLEPNVAGRIIPIPIGGQP